MVLRTVYATINWPKSQLPPLIQGLLELIDNLIIKLTYSYFYKTYHWCS